jgi:hypothetical protein
MRVAIWDGRDSEETLCTKMAIRQPCTSQLEALTAYAVTVSQDSENRLRSYAWHGACKSVPTRRILDLMGPSRAAYNWRTHCATWDTNSIPKQSTATTNKTIGPTVGP